MLPDLLRALCFVILSSLDIRHSSLMSPPTFPKEPPPMPYPAQPSEKAAVVAVVDPQPANNTTKATAHVDLRKRQEALFVAQVGAIDSTVDVKLQEAKDAGGTGVQDLSGKAATQLTAADDNKQVMLNLKAEELTINSGYTHARMLLTLGNGTAQLVAGVALGLCPRHGPASDDKATTVAQVVT